MTRYQNYPSVLDRDLRALYHTSADRFPDRPLILQKERGEYRSYTYAQFRADTDALTTALALRGLSRTRILLLGTNSYLRAVAWMACACIGTVIPIDPSLSPAQIASLAAYTEASAILYASTHAAAVAAAEPKGLRIPLESLPELIRAGHDRIAAGEDGYLSHTIDPQETCAILFTSGTEGRPRGVMLSHHNLCFDLFEMNHMVRITEEDRFLSVLPPHHIFELTCGFLCPLSRGASIVFCEGLRHLTQNMQETHPTVMLCVPLLLETIHRNLRQRIRRQGLEQDALAAARLTDRLPEGMRAAAKRRLFSAIHRNLGGRLRLIISGGVTADPSVLEGFRSIGITALQGYGLTECAPVAALNRDTCPNDRSVGMAPPNTLLDVCDVQEGGIGEIRIKGEQVMQGYFKEPQESARALRQGWLYTGDLGYLDGDGYLYLAGRKDNVLVTEDGKSIYPEELEARLGRSPYVREAAVVGYRSSRRGLVPVALICPDTTSLSAPLDTSLARQRLETALSRAISTVNADLPPHKRIATYALRKTPLPRNSAGKLLRRGLDAEFITLYRAQKKERS